MPNHTGKKPGKILSFSDETLNVEHCQHISDEESLLQRNYYLLKSLPEKASVDTLLTRFVIETRKLIPCDEIEYSALESAFHFIDGKPGRYQCCYQLRYLNIDLGEIKFSREVRFSDDEMEMLEIMVSGLIQPLQTRINHHKLLLHMEGKNNQLDTVMDELNVVAADAHVGKEL